MTPQVNRKAEPRNTSAVPRTRLLQVEATTPLQPPRITAQVALATPRGPVSMHKALLLRSARKVWETTRSEGLEGVIESGNVEVKRKSLSPRRKSKTPQKDIDQVVEQLEQEEAMDGIDGEEQGDESDSHDDSLEADVSLDIVSRS
jgi:hypothetical protein